MDRGRWTGSHRVRVSLRGDRGKYLLRRLNSAGEVIETRSTEARSRAEALRLAERWEAQLAEDLYRPREKTTWKEFRDLYESLHLSTLADRSKAKAVSTLDSFQASLRPGLIAEITPQDVLKWQARLRKQGRSEATVKSHSAHLKAALRWAVAQDLLSKAPRVNLPGRSVDTMKGRPITDKEFSSLIEAVSDIVGNPQAPSWEFLIEGLWLSGLRISEALCLTWHEGEFAVDLSHSRPMFRISAEAEKGHKNRLLPMAPEFAELIGSQGEGYVFNPQPRRGNKRPRLNWVVKVISKIGEASGVETKPGRYVKAHDLRRSFGFRWSRRVMPATLKEIMRHSEISTTMKFYVGQNAEASAEELWKAYSNQTSNQDGKTEQPDNSQKS